MQPEWGHASPGQGAPPGAAVHGTGALARSDVGFDASQPTLTLVGDRDRVTTRRPGMRFARRAKATLILADLLATMAALVSAAGFVVWTGAYDSTTDDLTRTALLSLPIWPILYAHQGLYQSRKVARRLEEFRRIVNSALTGVLVLAGISVILGDHISRVWLLSVAFCVTATLTIEREVIRRVIYWLRSHGSMTRRVVVIGRNEEAVEIAAAMAEHPEFGYEVVGYAADMSDGTVIDLREDADLGPYLGSPVEALDLVRSSGASGVIVATTGIDQESANRLIRDLTRAGVFVELTSAMRDISSSRVSVRPLGSYPVLCVEPVAQFSWRRVAKRTFDIVTASLLLVITSPVFIAAAVLIRTTSGRGVIFRQQRVGKDGATFRLYKLRTMVPDAEDRLVDLQAHNEAAGPMFKMADDPRVTPIGRHLRSLSIDELPQLFNVLKGDMSVVGPRPALPSEADQWDEQLRERLRVRPGITGMWQVSGRYTTSIETYARLDLYYVDNWSLVTDIAILARTVLVVLARHGGA